MTGHFGSVQPLHAVLSSLLHRMSHREMDEVFDRLGLEQNAGTKAERVAWALRALTTADLCVVSERYLKIRYDWELEESLFQTYDREQGNTLSQIVRREVAHCFDGQLGHLSGDLPLIPFLEVDWPLSQGLAGLEETLGIPSTGIKAQIQKHILNNDDWDAEQLFEQLGAMTCSTRRFQRMIQRAIHPEARHGPDAIKLVEALRRPFQRDGYVIEETASLSGYPIFEIARAASSGVKGHPKNIVFAAVGPKPEIGFSDAINNDIVLLSNATNCLVYDQAISADGLLWEQLVVWWQKSHPALSHEESRKSLGERLMLSLESEGEKNLFKTYFRAMRPIFDVKLPALIPQVYLHYDPATLKSLLERRQGKRLPRQRMDFLLLLANRRRIVIEIDGKHHFAADDGIASLEKYSEMVAADRDLRLAGYELYRFGANEVCGSRSEARISEFLTKLLQA